MDLTNKAVNYIEHGDTNDMEVGGDISSSGGGEYKTQKKVKGKQKNDVPDRFKGERPKKGESGKQAAKRVLTERGEYDAKKTGPGTDFNKLKKYFDTRFD